MPTVHGAKKTSLQGVHAIFAYRLPTPCTVGIRSCGLHSHGIPKSFEFDFFFLIANSTDRSLTMPVPRSSCGDDLATQGH